MSPSLFQRLCCLLVLFWVSAIQASALAADRGYAVPIGGALADDNEAVWGRLVELAGGKGARFVVFATASGEPAASGAKIVELLNRRGARAEVIAVAPLLPGIDVKAEVRREHWISKVRRARGVYFSGGAQERIVDTLRPDGQRTPLLEAIWEVYERGGVIAGSSAGAAIMSEVMFRDATDVLKVLQGQLRDGVEIDRGLGFVGPGLFVDQHFLRRGRIGRMLPLLQAKGIRLGLGVEENSAAIVHGDEVEVIGAKGALLVDLGASRSNSKLGVFNLENARLDYLDRGDRINLRTHQITPSKLKLEHVINPQAKDFKPYFETAGSYPDMLGDGTVLRAMSQLLDSPASEVRGLAFDVGGSTTGPQAGLGFEFRLYKAADTSGWFTTGMGGEDYTVSGIRLDVLPVRFAQPLYQPWPGQSP